MLLALAKKWAERRLRDDKAARRMQGYWLDELADHRAATSAIG